MRRLLAVVISTGLLVLLLAVPALADPMNPPNAFGQAIKGTVQTGDEPFGQLISEQVALINAGDTSWENFGEAILWIHDQLR